TGAGQFDQLNASGAATLNGTLAIATVNGFNPSPGQSFPVLTASSVTGTFATVTGRNIGQGPLYYDVQYNATNVTLIVRARVPVVTGYNPLAQKVKKTVTILGSNFTGATQALFSKDGGGTVAVNVTATDDGHIT